MYVTLQTPEWSDFEAPGAGEAGSRGSEAIARAYRACLRSRSVGSTDGLQTWALNRGRYSGNTQLEQNHGVRRSRAQPKRIYHGS